MRPAGRSLTLGELRTLTDGLPDTTRVGYSYSLEGDGRGPETNALVYAFAQAIVDGGDVVLVTHRARRS